MLKIKRMKTRDFRIGNLVYRLGEITKINGIHESISSVDYISTIKSGTVTINQIQKIPLTEEILLKCGFKSLADEMVYYSYYINRVFYLYAHVKNDEIIEFGLADSITCDECDSKNEYSKTFDIKYVHQLQNLYYALTNEELTIKL